MQEISNVGCKACQGPDLDFDFTFAFQPIVDVTTGKPFSYEALVRGTSGESAGEILGRVTEENRYRFDQSCRVRAVKLAAELKVPCYLNINFLPNAVYDPAHCIRSTLEAAQTYGFPTNRIVFEVTEGERIEDQAHLLRIIREYRRMGFLTAIDDFGEGYAGLNLLAEFQPHFLKIDMKLVKDVHLHQPRQAIVRGIVAMASELNVGVVAEGIEKAEEAEWLRNAGIVLQQGYYFARPGFECLPLAT